MNECVLEAHDLVLNTRLFKVNDLLVLPFASYNEKMRWIAIIVISILVNAVGLMAAANYVPGFTLSGSLATTVFVALILTLLNITLKPVLRLFLGPIIILTLGFGLILVNAFILYILDILSNNLMIEGIPALLWGSVIIGVLNFVAHLAEKS